MKDPRPALTDSFLSEVNSFAHELARGAREIALRHFREDNLSVEYKEPGQPVTGADLEIETFLRQRIEARYPEHGIIGEEHGSVRLGSDLIWTLDPIDGTRNFAAGIDTFGNLIALRCQDRPCIGIIDHPARDLCVSAVFGRGAWCGSRRLKIEATPLPPVIGTSTYAVFERTGHGPVLEKLLRQYSDSRIYYDCFAHTLTALNALRAVVEFNLKIWDFAPAEIIVTEAGGTYHELRRSAPSESASGEPTRYCAVFGETEMVRAIADFLAI